MVWGVVTVCESFVTVRPVNCAVCQIDVVPHTRCPSLSGNGVTIQPGAYRECLKVFGAVEIVYGRHWGEFCAS
jgi:hypothetical protein